MTITETTKLGDRDTIKIWEFEVDLIVGTDRNGKLQWQELSNLAFN